MAEQTKEEQELSLKLFTLAIKVAIVLFVVLAVLFYFNIIPSTDNKLIAYALLGIAFIDVFVLKFMTAKMRRKIDQS